MYINEELEKQLNTKVAQLTKEFVSNLGFSGPAERLGVLCIGPDYSGTVAMRVLHGLAKNRKLPTLICLDVPFPGEAHDNYQKIAEFLLPHLKEKFDVIVLIKAAVLSGKNYTWIVETLTKEGVGFDEKNIITVASVELESSSFKSKVVGQVVSDMPEFWWEADLEVWD